MANPIVPLTPAQTAHAEEQTAKEGYVHRALVGFDEFVNVLLDGAPDETISSRMARWATEDNGLKRDIGTAVSRGLELFQRDHGAEAEAGDAERGQAVVKLEKESGNISL